MSISTRYRKPRLVKAKQGWYINYSYRVPNEIRHFYKSNWVRFRVIEDMNRRKGKEREEYAEWLLNETINLLRNGFDPLKPQVEHIKKQEAALVVPDILDADRAFKQFLEAWGKRGLEPVSLAKYKKCVNRLCEWLHKNKMLYADVRNIKTDHIEKFLDDGRTDYGFSNREYNNTFDFIRTAFNYLVKKEIITKSPCAGIDKSPVKSKKHRFYDKKSLSDITKALIVSDPYCYLAAQTVYYLCIRADKELMNFKVGNIFWEQNKILLDSGGTKGDSARYVPMDDNIKKLFLDRGIDKAPTEWYVFGIKGVPAAEKFGSGFFAKRFRKVRDAAGLSDDFTLYGFKHTRVVNLKSDGLPDADIMSLTGHKDFVAYAKYLKDLGLDANPEKINTVSRKI